MIGRRNFLKIVGSSLAALPYNLLSLYKPGDHSVDLPYINLDVIPNGMREIIQRIPKAVIRPDGLLWIWDSGRREYRQSQLVPTQWNIERNNPFERLFIDKSWGIVLHWFGVSFNGDQSLAGYMRGFNGMRQVGEYHTKTSAHFLVGDTPADEIDDQDRTQVGIIQTQLPDSDGIPLVASHLSGLDHQAHQAKKQYFVRAYYELGYANPSIHSILTEFYDGPKLDPNYRTIAIEMTGLNFDQKESAPSVQQLANVVGVIYALMARYQIPAMNILGHHEIELRKPDPGKNFMALIRYLIGIYALYLRDWEFFKLVFGNFISEGQEPWSGVTQYFQFIRNYFIAIGLPDQVYQWERSVNYWNFFNSISTERLYNSSTLQPFHEFYPPIKKKVVIKKDRFLSPPGHEGIDLFLAQNGDVYNPEKKIEVFLPAKGQCLQLRNTGGCGFGYQVIFRHLQPDGAEILTVLSNLNEITPLEKGRVYATGHPIGSVLAGGPLGEGFLHFAVAYGATWDSVLRSRPVHPSGVTSDWIRRRYIDPQDYLLSWQAATDLVGPIN
jgi:hypothetical protein